MTRHMAAIKLSGQFGVPLLGHIRAMTLHQSDPDCSAGEYVSLFAIGRYLYQVRTND